VVNFNDESYLDADFTSDIRVLEQGLARLDARGGTAMRDAIRNVDRASAGEIGSGNKKVILVVTDGNDNSSNYGLNELVRLAQQNDVMVYAIGILATEDKAERRRRTGTGSCWWKTHNPHHTPQQTGVQGFYPQAVTEVEAIATPGGA